MLDMSKILFLHAKGDSMRPIIQPDDIILVRPCLPGKLRIGDLVVYQNEDICIHRLIRINQRYNKMIYITKGDNLFFSDTLCAKDKIIGKAFALIRDTKTIYLDKRVIRLVTAYIAYIESIIFEIAFFIKKKIFGERKLKLSTYLYGIIHMPFRFILNFLKPSAL